MRGEATRVKKFLGSVLFHRYYLTFRFPKFDGVFLWPEQIISSGLHLSVGFSLACYFRYGDRRYHTDCMPGETIRVKKLLPSVLFYCNYLNFRSQNSMVYSYGPSR